MPHGRGALATLVFATLLFVSVLVSAPRDARAADGDAPVPAFLVMTIAPATLLADAEPIEALFIQLVDGQGRAAVASTPVSVLLASNDPRVVTVPLSAEIPIGQSAVTASITALKEGAATVTGQASGLAAAQAQVSVRGITALAQATVLGLEFTPRTFIIGAGGPSSLTVSLLAGGTGPASAASDLQVRLVSSAPEVLEVPESVTIPSGAFSASVDVYARGTGTATVSALRSGFSSASQTAKVVDAAPTAGALQVVARPGKILAGGGAAPQLVIQAGSGDSPSYFPCGSLELSSSQPGVVAVPDRFTPECDLGWQAVVVPTTVGTAGGATSITVARAGMAIGQVAIEALGTAPARLALLIAPPAIAYDASFAGWLVVQVQDASGAPVRVGADLTLIATGAEGLVSSSTVVSRGRSSTVIRLGSLRTGAAPTVRMTGPGLPAAEVIVRSATTGLPATTASAETPSAIFVIGAVRIPVAWVFAFVVLALLGLAAVIARSNRSQLRT